MDGCHLKGCTGSQVLAVGDIDGNYSMYPIAYAVVEGENKSWKWFIEILKDDITNKQKGLMRSYDNH